MDGHMRQFQKRKKLNLSVKRDFQIWLLGRILGVVFVSSLVAVLILYFYARQEISSSFYSAHIQIRRVSDLLWPVLAAGAFVSLASGMVLALFLPQKIAGPLFRIEKGLAELGRGNLADPVVLRKNDIFTELADSVNHATGDLRGRVQEVKLIQQELDRIIVELENQEARAVSARQKDALDRFRT